MNNPQEILTQLKNKGYKITKARSLIIEVFLNRPTPITALDLIEAFRSAHIPANKTTIYREIAFLLEQKIIKEVEFGEGIKRYEIAGDAHHHHLVCIKCKKIEDVDIKADLQKQEQIILQQKKV